jgi:hypothetical protein
MHALAYDSVRDVIAAAAEEPDEQPMDSSFKGALQALESFREEVGNAEPRGWGARRRCDAEDDRVGSATVPTGWSRGPSSGGPKLNRLRSLGGRCASD